MLDRGVAEFHEFIWAKARQHGRSAPKIVDEILAAFYPKTLEASKEEGAHSHLRNGLCAYLCRFFKREAGNSSLISRQRDFSDIDNRFAPIVRKIDRAALRVPSLDEYVPMADLISTPEWLDEARKSLRSLALDDLRVADLADELYEAVMASRAH